MTLSPEGVFSPDDVRFMRRALELAARGEGHVSPNPLVGAVLVRDGVIVGEGAHERFGGPHAEVQALRDAGESARGATAYVTLEPCHHFGKTPPCVDALAAAGVGRVVAAMADPNPAMSGASFGKLRAMGIEASCGLLAGEAASQNEVYLVNMRERRPFWTLKVATSLDGRIAAADGSSKWITGEEARLRVHRLRATHDAVLAGVGTVIADDPLLTVRIEGNWRQPRRIILDPRSRTPMGSRLLREGETAPLIVVCSESRATQELVRCGAEVLVLPGKQPESIDLTALSVALFNLNIGSVLVEGGGETITRLLQSRICDKLVAFVAPVLVGNDGLPWYRTQRGKIGNLFRWRDVTWFCVGGDGMLTGYPDWYENKEE